MLVVARGFNFELILISNLNRKVCSTLDLLEAWFNLDYMTVYQYITLEIKKESSVS